MRRAGSAGAVVRGRPPADPPPPETAGATAREYIASVPADRFPHLVAVANHFEAGDPDERFELLIDIFVDGLARRART